MLVAGVRFCFVFVQIPAHQSLSLAGQTELTADKIMLSTVFLHHRQLYNTCPVLKSPLNSYSTCPPPWDKKHCPAVINCRLTVRDSELGCWWRIAQEHL